MMTYFFGVISYIFRIFFRFQDHVPQLNRCPAFTYFTHFHVIMTMIALKAA